VLEDWYFLGNYNNSFGYLLACLLTSVMFSGFCFNYLFHKYREQFAQWSRNAYVPGHFRVRPRYPRGKGNNKKGGDKDKKDKKDKDKKV